MGQGAVATIGSMATLATRNLQVAGWIIGDRVPKSPSAILESIAHSQISRFIGQYRTTAGGRAPAFDHRRGSRNRKPRSEEHTSELQSHLNLVCRLLLEKKKTYKKAEPLSDSLSASTAR